MSRVVEEGKLARRQNVDRSKNPYQEISARIQWYEGWDAEHEVAPKSTGGSTWNTGNIPGG